MHILLKKYSILIKISLQRAPMIPVDKSERWFKVMTWPWKSDIDW